MAEEKIELPKTRKPAQRMSPGLLTMYGPQKTGKTFWTTRLPNALTLDFEKGTETHEAMAYPIENLNKLMLVSAALSEEKKTNGFMYDWLVIDTLDRFIEHLETKVKNDYNAKQNYYKDQNPDKEFPLVSVYSEIEYGKGYDLLRLEVRKWITFFKSVAHRVILIAHLKRTMIGETSVIVDDKSLDLTGKIKGLILSDSDATCSVSSLGAATILSFVAKPNSSSGSRLPYLAGKKFKLIPGEPEFGWNQIYPDYPKEEFIALHPVKFEVEADD